MRRLEFLAEKYLQVFFYTPARHRPLTQGGHCTERHRDKKALEVGGPIDADVKKTLKNMFQCRTVQRKNSGSQCRTVQRKNSGMNNTKLKRNAGQKVSSDWMAAYAWQSDAASAGSSLLVSISRLPLAGRDESMCFLQACLGPA
jgi:hypothetical protein